MSTQDTDSDIGGLGIARPEIVDEDTSNPGLTAAPSASTEASNDIIVDVANNGYAANGNAAANTGSVAAADHTADELGSGEVCSQSSSSEEDKSQSEVDIDPVQARLDEEQRRMRMHYEDRPRSPIQIIGDDYIYFASGTLASGRQVDAWNRTERGPKPPSKLRVASSIDDPWSESSPEREDSNPWWERGAPIGVSGTQQTTGLSATESEPSTGSMYVSKSGFNWADDDENEEALKEYLEQSRGNSNAEGSKTTSTQPDMQHSAEDVIYFDALEQPESVLAEKTDETQSKQATDSEVEEIEQLARPFSPTITDGTLDRPPSRHGPVSSDDTDNQNAERSTSHSSGEYDSASQVSTPSQGGAKPMPQNAGSLEADAQLDEPGSPTPSNTSSVESTTGMTQSEGLAFADAYDSDVPHSLAKQRSVLKERERGRPALDMLPEKPEDRIQLLEAKVHRYREERNQWRHSCWNMEQQRNGYQQWAESEHEMAERERRRADTKLVAVGTQTDGALRSSAGEELEAHLQPPQEHGTQSEASSTKLETEAADRQKAIDELQVQLTKSEMHRQKLAKEIEALEARLAELETDREDQVSREAVLRDENGRLRKMAQFAHDSAGEKVDNGTQSVDVTASETGTPDTASPPSSRLARWAEREARIKNTQAYKDRLASLRQEMEVEEEKKAKLWKLRLEAYQKLCGWDEIPYVSEQQRLDSLRNIATTW